MIESDRKRERGERVCVREREKERERREEMIEEI